MTFDSSITSLQIPIASCFICAKNSKTEILFLSTLNFKHCASLDTILGIYLFLLGKVCQLQHPPSPVVVPGKAAVTPPGEQNRPPLGRAVKAKMVDGSQTGTTVNPFSKAAKSTECVTEVYSSYILKVKYARDRP